MIADHRLGTLACLQSQQCGAQEMLVVSDPNVQVAGQLDTHAAVIEGVDNCLGKGQVLAR